MRVMVAVMIVVAVTAGRPALAAPTPAPPALDGAALYAQYCKPCHGGDLKGYAADNAPSLVSPTFQDTASDAFLRSAIERGRAGTAMGGYGKRFGGPLGPSEVSALITYLRGGTKAKPLAEQRANGTAALGEPLYTTHCETCHGSAKQRATAVHLANAMFLETASDSFLRVAIVDGRPGTAMAPWGATLTPRQIEDVVAYIRSLAHAVPPPGAGELLSLEDVPIVIHPAGAPVQLPLRDERYVSIDDLAKAYADKRRLVIVDARPPSDYLRMHITGAISIPHYDMRDIEKIPNDGTWVITYCACPHHVSGIVMEELRKRGYSNSAVLDEGIFAWQLKGHPTVVAPGQLPIPAPPVNVPNPPGPTNAQRTKNLNAETQRR